MSVIGHTATFLSSFQTDSKFNIRRKEVFGKKKESAPVKAEEKAGAEASQEVTIFALDEILKKIESLSEPGSTVFLYIAGSPASGGPFGRGAAVVEVNPNYPGPKQKKYNLYADNVDGSGQPVGKRQLLFSSDKTKEVASWIKERHHKPFKF